MDEGVVLAMMRLSWGARYPPDPSHRLNQPRFHPPQHQNQEQQQGEVVVDQAPAHHEAPPLNLPPHKVLLQLQAQASKPPHLEALPPPERLALSATVVVEVPVSHLGLHLWPVAWQALPKRPRLMVVVVVIRAQLRL